VRCANVNHVVQSVEADVVFAGNYAVSHVYFWLVGSVRITLLRSWTGPDI